MSGITPPLWVITPPARAENIDGHLLYTRPWAQHLLWINSLNPHSHLPRQVYSSSPFRTRALSNLLSVTEPSEAEPQSFLGFEKEGDQERGLVLSRGHPRGGWRESPPQMARSQDASLPGLREVASSPPGLLPAFHLSACSGGR